MHYYELPLKSQIATELLEFAAITDAWQDYYNFQTVAAPEEIVSKDPQLVKLFATYPFIAGIIKLTPNTCYDWHVDTRRGVSINMLLSANDHSHCLFAEAEGVQFPFKELKYKPETYYIFNNQVRHAVLNFGVDRYLFTIEFNAPKEQLPFNQLHHYFDRS